MKYKTTKKEVMSNYKCFSVGYCRLQYLLHYETPESYTCGRDGWYADIYNIGDGRAIVTGYAPFGATVDYDIAAEYDRKAEKILHGRKYRNYESQKKALDNLISKFMNAIERSC